jgi:site-specific DNA-methyltransferase (adenine-specific)
MIDLFPELKDAKSIRQMKSWADNKSANIMRVADVKNNVIDYGEIEKKIILGDSVEVIKTIPSESFNAIITDPPFGLAYDERKAGTSGSLTDYEDSEVSYERLLTMAPELFRVLRPNGFLVWFFGISWYERVKTDFRAAGFIVDEIPIIWNRSEGRCHTNRPDRYFGRAYDVALHCIKGDPQIIQRMKPNVITVKPVENSDREALVERPVDLYAELIRRLTVPGETVADFFVGSGSCPAAAASLGRDYFGVEQSPERRAIAIKKIRAYSPEAK